MKPSFIEESSTRSMLAIVKFVKKVAARAWRYNINERRVNILDQFWGIDCS